MANPCSCFGYDSRQCHRCIHVVFVVAALTVRLWLYSHLLLPVAAFTVVPDSSSPSTIVDAPQTGLSMKAHGGARTDPDEQAAVYEIMRATGNPWAASIPDVCRGRWHGIECMPDADEVYHVVSLSFGALSDDTAFPICDQAAAYISPAVARLPHLRSLFFYRCSSLNPRPIPAFLGRLGTSLRSLVLRENGHVGPIPSELGNLTRLRVLDLHANGLSSSIPAALSALSDLRSLDLSGNRLAGPVPQLPTRALSVLDLSRNLLRGPVPTWIGEAQSLIKLDLSRNQLTGPIPPSAGRLRSLILLDLSYNHLGGPLPTSLGGLTTLQALILSANPMGPTGLPDAAFLGLKELQILVLSNMGLEGPIPASMGRLPTLRIVHLDGNRLNGSIPESFRSMTGLTELRVNSNLLIGPIPFDRETVWRMGRKLRLSNNTGLCYNPRHSDDQVQGEDGSVLGIGVCS